MPRRCSSGYCPCGTTSGCWPSSTILHRQVGNFPQAFSHIGLINTAYNLCRVSGPARQRADLGDSPRADETSRSRAAGARHTESGVD